MNALHINEFNKNGELVKSYGNKTFNNFIELTLWLKNQGFEKKQDASKMMSFFKIKKNGNILYAHVIR